MQPLDQALGFRVGGAADDHLRGQGAAETLAFLGQLGAPATPPADGTFPVPDQRPRDRAQRLDELPPAGIQILRPPGRDQHR